VNSDTEWRLLAYDTPPAWCSSIQTILRMVILWSWLLSDFSVLLIKTWFVCTVVVICKFCLYASLLWRISYCCYWCSVVNCTVWIKFNDHVNNCSIISYHGNVIVGSHGNVSCSRYVESADFS